MAWKGFSEKGGGGGCVDKDSSPGVTYPIPPAQFLDCPGPHIWTHLLLCRRAWPSTRTDTKSAGSCRSRAEETWNHTERTIVRRRERREDALGSRSPRDLPAKSGVMVGTSYKPRSGLRVPASECEGTIRRHSLLETLNFRPQPRPMETDYPLVILMPTEVHLCQVKCGESALFV